MWPISYQDGLVVARCSSFGGQTPFSPETTLVLRTRRLRPPKTVLARLVQYATSAPCEGLFVLFIYIEKLLVALREQVRRHSCNSDKVVISRTRAHTYNPNYMMEASSYEGFRKIKYR